MTQKMCYNLIRRNLKMAVEVAVSSRTKLYFLIREKISFFIDMNMKI